MTIVDSQRPLRIIIADPHPSARENLRYLLSAERDLEVVGVVRDAATALRLTLKLRPDVLVVDFDLADYDGLTVARALGRERGLRVVLRSTNRHVCESVHSQVDACLSTDDSPTVLLNAIREARRPATRTQPRVLVVEDDATIRGAIRTALEEDGLDIVETSDGLEALAECRRRAPGVVILDLGLPRMSGQDFVAAYRNLGVKPAPIVVLSARPDARQVARALGAAAFLPKPFSLDRLSQVVRRVA
jgi:DNA-binding NarL/FixJ family response regulator